MNSTSFAKPSPNFALIITRLRLQLNTHYARLLQRGLRKQWGCNTASVGRFDESLWMESFVMAVVAMLNWQLAVMLMLAWGVCSEWYAATFTATAVSNYEELAGFGWAKVGQQCRSVLEYVKFARMVDWGYELRSNTNLMLMEEMQADQLSQRNLRSIGEKQKQLQGMVVAAYGQLMEIGRIGRKIEVCSGNYGQLEHQIPLKFKDIFEMNRSVGQAVQSFSNLAANFKEKQVSPCQFTVQLIYCNLITKNQLLPCMSNFRKTVEEMHSLVTQLLEARQLNEQNIKILHFLQGEDSPHLEEIQQICTRFELSIRPTVKQPSSQEPQLFQSSPNSQPFIFDDRSTAVQRKTDTFAINRRQFMRRLDTVLTIGMARRKQEQFQRKMREEQQAQKLLSDSQPNPPAS